MSLVARNWASAIAENWARVIVLTWATVIIENQGRVIAMNWANVITVQKCAACHKLGYWSAGKSGDGCAIWEDNQSGCSIVRCFYVELCISCLLRLDWGAFLVSPYCSRSISFCQNIVLSIPNIYTPNWSICK